MTAGGRSDRPCRTAKLNLTSLPERSHVDRNRHIPASESLSTYERYVHIHRGVSRYHTATSSTHVARCICVAMSAISLVWHIRVGGPSANQKTARSALVPQTSVRRIAPRAILRKIPRTRLRFIRPRYGYAAMPTNSRNERRVDDVTDSTGETDPRVTGFPLIRWSPHQNTMPSVMQFRGRETGRA